MIGRFGHDTDLLELSFCFAQGVDVIADFERDMS